MPFLSVTCHVHVPLPFTGVVLFTPGPERWKLCVFAVSLTTIVYLPGFSVVTFFVPCLSVILKAPSGPVEPTRRFADDAPIAEEARARPAAQAARARVRRVIGLLLVGWGRWNVS